jgi:hypothetical protein
MTTFQNSPLMLTKPMAHSVVRFVAGSFAADMPMGGYTETELQTLSRKLSFMIDADVQWTTLDHLVETLRELDELDRGGHHMLNVNRSGTVDNSIWLLDNIQQRITEAVGYVLMTAHFSASYNELKLAAA